jgi:hypothetical protein
MFFSGYREGIFYMGVYLLFSGGKGEDWKALLASADFQVSGLMDILLMSKWQIWGCIFCHPLPV